MANKDRNGCSFSYATIEAVWRKALAVPGHNPRDIRKDLCGAWIKRSHYGNTDSDFGWEVDHVWPATLGGTDGLSNLQPLHWQNNRKKADSVSGNFCAVVAYQ